MKAGAAGVQLRTSLAAAQAATSDTGEAVILAVEPERLEALRPAGDGSVFVPRVPAAAFCNLDPHRPLRAVTAGGGYVLRREALRSEHSRGASTPGAHTEAAGLEVVLIYRRGAWDLPKGKQDPGEAVPDCALREVREEIGVRALKLVQPLGATVHGYADGEVFAVKTTHWFGMHTPEAEFTPERREGIEQVRWVPWAEAQLRVGFATLSRHMRHIAPFVEGSDQ